MAKDTNYTSETMNFIREYTKNKPELEKKRDALRKTWWDKDEQEVNEDRNLDKNNLGSGGYVYFSYNIKQDKLNAKN